MCVGTYVDTCVRTSKHGSCESPLPAYMYMHTETLFIYLTPQRLHNNYIPQTLLKLMEHGVIIYSPTWSVAIKAARQRGGTHACHGSTYVGETCTNQVCVFHPSMFGHTLGDPNGGLWKFAELADVFDQDRQTGRQTDTQVEVGMGCP